MPARLRSEIEDGFIADLSCAICSAPALRVNHLQDYADYVSCEECGSSFVVEADGERVLYGRISEQYPDTEKAVLKTWVTLASVAHTASAERERKAAAQPDIPDAAAPPADDVQAAALLEAPADAAPELSVQEIPRAEVPLLPSIEGEPPTEAAQVLADKRYRVRISQDKVFFPASACAHCSSSPAESWIAIRGSLPIGNNPAQWRRANFRLPLCAKCHKTATARSIGQRNARLQAHLTSMVVGLALVVAAMSLGVIDFARNFSIGLLLLGIFAVAGYLLPLGLLLPRARSARPSPETSLIETTLQMHESTGNIAESFFDFRNESYARLFFKFNPNSVVGEVKELEMQAEASQSDG